MKLIKYFRHSLTKSFAVTTLSNAVLFSCFIVETISKLRLAWTLYIGRHLTSHVNVLSIARRRYENYDLVPISLSNGVFNFSNSYFFDPSNADTSLVSSKIIPSSIHLLINEKLSV